MISFSLRVIHCQEGVFPTALKHIWEVKLPTTALILNANIDSSRGKSELQMHIEVLCWFQVKATDSLIDWSVQLIVLFTCGSRKERNLEGGRVVGVLNNSRSPPGQQKCFALRFVAQCDVLYRLLQFNCAHRMVKVYCGFTITWWDIIQATFCCMVN